MFPEVVFLAETEDPFRRDPFLFIPDLESLVIFFVNGRIQTVGGKPRDVRQEVPGPVDRFFFEVIAEREIAEHLKERTVAAVLADVVDIAGTDALLAGRDAAARRDLLTGKIRL